MQCEYLLSSGQLEREATETPKTGSYNWIILVQRITCLFVKWPAEFISTFGVERELTLDPR